MKGASLGFYGGVDEVTGANFLLRTGGANLVIDCGLSHGKFFDNYRPFYDTETSEESFSPEALFGYRPTSIDAVFITHAHIDHIGRLPRLVREGFSGPVYSTPATKELSRLMLIDALGIMTEEARRRGLEPLYAREDIARTMSLWQTKDYHRTWPIGDGVSARFLDAGHILGSAMVEFSRAARKIVFTGDLGNSPAPLLPETEKISGAHYLVMESVYGDRNHEDRAERRRRLAEAIADTAARKGTLLIPSFALQRTQILILEIHRIFTAGEAPSMPVYLDSPLAAAVTEIFYKYRHLFNARVRAEMAGGEKIFDYPHFVEVKTPEESYRLSRKKGPKIIMASSGMSVGGRVLAHERVLLERKKTIFLFVGYQARGTLGRLIQDGRKKLRIDGRRVRVKAEIRTLRGYSAHKDRDNLFRFVADAADTLEEVFVVMGEPESSASLAKKIRDGLSLSVRTCRRGEIVEIDF
ncbi:MAG TPA: MBL fold metallo-hydrolase [Candidatus Moranbacteria bacterium]|nr:MBL fold metallo-hydrolase [Candidatus Moranbacteria bacterium]